MDKERQHVFFIGNMRIVISNGEAREFYYGKTKTLPQEEKFYDFIEIAMNKLAVNSPRKFEEMYRSFNFNTREYKMAKALYEKIKG